MQYAEGVKKEEIHKLPQDSCTESKNLDSCTESKDIIREGSFLQDDESLPHHNESLWFLKDFSRKDAVKILCGKPDGTFLIRNIRTPDQYALSLVANGKVGHCLIYEKERLFGFAEPYIVHPSLKSLVLHYAQTSLEVHNDTLKTTLAYPVFSLDL